MACIRQAFFRVPVHRQYIMIYSQHVPYRNNIRYSSRCLELPADAKQKDGLGSNCNYGRRFKSRSHGDAKPKLDFDDTVVAYRGKTTLEIARALFVLKMCQFDVLVTYNMQIMKFFRKLLGKTFFEAIMKMSFYRHFVAGEDAVSIKPEIDRLAKFGIGPILDYSVESDMPQSSDDSNQRDPVVADKDDKDDNRKTSSSNEAEYERNVETLVQCVDAASATSSGAFAAVKVTALARPQLLLDLSESLTQTRQLFGNIAGTDVNLAKGKLPKNDFQNEMEKQGVMSKIDAGEWFTWLDNDNDGLIDILDWERMLRPDTISKLPHHISVPKENRVELARVLERTSTIAERARDKGVHLTVDAEQTYFQPAINWITIQMQRKFNSKSPVVFNTYQCYLKEAFNHLTIDMELAKKDTFHIAAKLVRGAYMEQERSRAKELGVIDPINESYEATGESYKRCLNLMLQSISKGERVSLMVASHNEDTIRFTVKRLRQFSWVESNSLSWYRGLSGQESDYTLDMGKPVRMQELQISTNDRVVLFGQLLGMCDHVSFPLGQAGFSVFKYIPYGPVSDVLPYLTRRAQENRGIQKSALKERQMLWKELKRRIRRGKIFYRP